MKKVLETKRKKARVLSSNKYVEAPTILGVQHPFENKGFYPASL